MLFVCKLPQVARHRDTRLVPAVSAASDALGALMPISGIHPGASAAYNAVYDSRAPTGNSATTAVTFLLGVVTDPETKLAYGCALRRLGPVLLAVEAMQRATELASADIIRDVAVRVRRHRVLREALCGWNRQLVFCGIPPDADTAVQVVSRSFAPSRVYSLRRAIDGASSDADAISRITRVLERDVADRGCRARAAADEAFAAHAAAEALAHPDAAPDVVADLQVDALVADEVSRQRHGVLASSEACLGRFVRVTSGVMLRQHRLGVKQRALVSAAAAAVSPVPAQRKARAEVIKSARESARTGQRDAAAARRAAHKRRRGPLFASSAADVPGSAREVKEAKVLGKGTGGANVVRVLASPVVWCATVVDGGEASDSGSDGEGEGVGSSASGDAGIL